MARRRQMETVGIVVTLVLVFAAQARAQGGSWDEKAPLAVGRAGVQAEAVGGMVYAIGGTEGGCQASLATEAYDPGTNTWTSAAVLSNPPGEPCQRFAFATTVVDGQIYAFGGGNGSIFFHDVQVYDPATDSWSVRNPMPTSRAYGVAAALNGKIYLIGGHVTSGGPNAPTLEYDPISDTWTEKAAMLTHRINPGIAVVNGKFYVVGGATTGPAVATVEIYDPVADEWSIAHDLSTPRMNPAVGAVGGLIYAFGGVNDGWAIVNSGEVYDPALDMWSDAPALPQERTVAGSAVLDDVLYVIGGQNNIVFANPETFAFTPSSSGLRLWLRSDMGLTVDGSGKVQTWADQSGSGHDFTQNTAAARPTLTAEAGPGGADVVHFDGIDDVLENSAQLVAGTSVTIFTVMAVREPGYPWVLGSPFHEPPSRLIYEGHPVGGVDSPNYFDVAHDRHNDARAMFPGINDDQYKVLTITGSGRMGDVQVFVNGEPAAMTLTGGDVELTFSPGNTLGFVSLAPKEFTDVAFVEFIVYDRELNETERESVEARLMRRYFTADADGDGVADAADNCPLDANTDQADTNGDGKGDACDTDDDGDGVADGIDAFPLNVFEWADTDNDGLGNNSDGDDDNDGIADDIDTEPLIFSDDYRLDAETFGHVLPRELWTVSLSAVPPPPGDTAGRIRASVSGTGAVDSSVGACSGNRKEIKLGNGEVAEWRCAGTTLIFRAVAGTAEVWELVAGKIWVLTTVPEGQEMSIGSPVTAAAGNFAPIDVALLDEGLNVFGSFTLNAAQSVNVQLVDGGAGQDVLQLEVLQGGEVTVTVFGHTTTLSERDDPMTFSLEPPPTIAELIEQVDGLALSSGAKRSLLAKLTAAERSIARHQAGAARGTLGAFGNEVAALKRKGVLAAAVADALIADAQEIGAALHERP